MQAPRNLTLAALALCVTRAFAAEPAGAGFVTDSSGNPVVSSSNACWRTSSWTPGMARGCLPGTQAASGTPVAPSASTSTSSQPPEASSGPPVGASDAGSGSVPETSGGLVDSSGQPVRTSYGDCWGTAFSRADPACAASAGASAASTAATAATAAAAVPSSPPEVSPGPLVGASDAGSGSAPETSGGLVDSSGQPVRTSFGDCWGTTFSPADPACGASGGMSAAATAATAATTATAAAAASRPPEVSPGPLVGASDAGSGSVPETSGGLVDSSGQPVRTSFGDCWGTGFSRPDSSCGIAAGGAAVAGAAATSGAAMKPSAASGSRSALAAPAGGNGKAGAFAPATARGNPGYVVDSNGVVVRSSQGECWRTGSWSPALANVVGCDGVLARAEPVPAPAPSPRPEPVPPAATEPPPPEPATGSELQAAPDLPVPPTPPVPAPTAPSASAAPPAPSEPLPPAAAVPTPPTPPSAAPSDLAPPRAAPDRADAAPDREPAPEEPRTEKVTLATDAYFDFDKAVLKAEGQRKLDELASRLLKTKLEVVVATGHTDWTGPDSYNKKLSQRRAQAVKEYLASKGVPADRIFTEGKGEQQPVATNKTREGRAQNRRVEVEVVGTRPLEQR